MIKIDEKLPVRSVLSVTAGDIFSLLNPLCSSKHKTPSAPCIVIAGLSGFTPWNSSEQSVQCHLSTVCHCTYQHQTAIYRNTKHLYNLHNIIVLLSSKLFLLFTVHFDTVRLSKSGTP
jgi:hypothetical protein